MTEPVRFALKVLEFQCIAERCEETCCSGLAVTMSEQRLQRMRERVAGSPDAQAVEANILPNPAGAPTDGAVIRMRPDGSCPFLDTERLCSLQRRHGEKALPDICSTFPRVMWRWGGQVEVTGSLACPEMARLLLLQEGAMELVPGAGEQVPRLESARPLPGLPGDVYGVHAELIRSAALRIMQRRELPMASRLAILGQLAFRLDSIFQGAVRFAEDDEQTGQVMRKLLQPFDTPETLEAMHREFSELEFPGSPCAGMIASVLKARGVVTRGQSFGPFISGVLASLWGSEEAAGDPEAAWREYAARWARLEALHGPRVEQYFRHYGVNQWFRAPFTESPHLLHYVFRLALRVAMMRLVLVGHPEVAALCAEGQALATEASQAALDRAAVECFYRITRHVEQAPELLALVKSLAGTGGAETLGKTLVFAKF
jgi:lysine-N-methylase